MTSALELARDSLLLTSPNPRVGAIFASAEGHILGKGHTQRAGGPHAEIVAMRDAQAQGHSLRSATAYVTLEPCSHHGRTGPCCDALIAAGIKKVVASIADPNPLVSGQGFARLRAAGIEVEVGPGAAESRELNIGFFSRMIRKTPWVRMKVAASLDGKTALDNGKSQWITSDAARTDGHAWRARSCAMLTGIGTVLEDNPRLDVRLVDTPRQPHLVVVDSRLETPLDAHLFITGRALYIYASEQNDAKEAALEARGATVVYLPGKGGKVDLAAMLRDLALRGLLQGQRHQPARLVSREDIRLQMYRMLRRVDVGAKRRKELRAVLQQRESIRPYLEATAHLLIKLAESAAWSDLRRPP